MKNKEGKKLVTVFEFANDLKNHVLKVNLSNNEIRSLAKAIGHPLGCFNRKKGTVLLNELLFLNAHFGLIVLREFSFTDNNQISHYIVEEIINSYLIFLLKELSDNFMFNEFHERTNAWKKLFRNVHDSNELDKDFSSLTAAFYETLYKEPCPKDINRVLSVRFKSYFDFIVATIKRMETNLRYIIK